MRYVLFVLRYDHWHRCPVSRVSLWPQTTRGPGPGDREMRWCARSEGETFVVWADCQWRASASVWTSEFTRRSSGLTQCTCHYAQGPGSYRRPHKLFTTCLVRSSASTPAFHRDRRTGLYAVAMFSTYLRLVSTDQTTLEQFPRTRRRTEKAVLDEMRSYCAFRCVPFFPSYVMWQRSFLR